MEDCNFFSGISCTLKCFIIICVEGVCVCVSGHGCVCATSCRGQKTTLSSRVSVSTVSSGDGTQVIRFDAANTFTH